MTKTMAGNGTEGRRADGTFLPGHGGRTKGSRNKLGEQFLHDLQELWQAEGADVLKEARADKPMDFARMVASLLPKELLVRKAPEDEMSDSELADAIDNLGLVAAELRRRGQTHAGSDAAN